MQKDRTLNWHGMINVRDLGGLETGAGRRVKWGAVVRGDDPAKLTPLGWADLYVHGIRTIISLRTDGMDEDDLVVPDDYKGIDAIPAAIEDLRDKEFLETWAKSDLWSTPLYYEDAIARWPKRHAAVFTAIAQAKEGGVLFHCKRGVDRTGIISLMLLALLGVPEEEIVNDYVLSIDPERDKLLKERGTNSREVIRNALKDLDMNAYLVGAGMGQEEIDTVRDRLLE